MNATKDRIAWHYTIGKHAASIIEGGVIRGATEHVPTGEMPVVWFSLRQHWEPTANKMIRSADGTVRFGTMADTIRIGGGWRFGLPVSELLPYRDLKRAANISGETARGLERVARRQGADPALWYGSLTPVEVSRCIVQILDIEA